MSDVLVIIHTYNEIENITAILETVMKYPDGFDVLVIDDNSPDGTAEAVKKMMEKFPNRIFLEQRKGKLGLGTAYIHGFKWALNRLCRCCHRIKVYIRSECSELADGACADVVFRICLRKIHHSDETEGFHCRIRMLSAQSA